MINDFYLTVVFNIRLYRDLTVSRNQFFSIDKKHDRVSYVVNSTKIVTAFNLADSSLHIY